MECPQCHCYLYGRLVPPDPVPHSVKGQFFPTPERMALWSAFKASKQADARLTRNLLDLEYLLGECRRSRKKHRRFMARHRPMQTACRRLPTELWAEIFQFASDNEDKSTGGVIFKQGTRNEAPMSVSQVC